MKKPRYFEHEGNTFYYLGNNYFKVEPYDAPDTMIEDRDTRRKLTEALALEISKDIKKMRSLDKVVEDES